MAIKDLLNTMKSEGVIIPELEKYLLSLNGEDNNRAIDVNAPSQTGACLRSRYFARKGFKQDNNSVSPRLRRIFDNGHGVHERLQHYLEEDGILLMDEVPVHNYEYNIQGHTDGILNLRNNEKAILEIKSMNSFQFRDLKEPKPEHIEQGLTYIYCLEERRKYLKEKYKSKVSFQMLKPQRLKEYASLYQHLQGGRKFTREEKIQFQCSLHDKMDTILFNTSKPITKSVFLYENKDTQDLKEFVISSLDAKLRNVMDELLKDFHFLNECVANSTVPSRPLENCTKSCSYCKFCSYKTVCYQTEE